MMEQYSAHSSNMNETMKSWIKKKSMLCMIPFIPTSRTGKTNLGWKKSEQWLPQERRLLTERWKWEMLCVLRSMSATWAYLFAKNLQWDMYASKYVNFTWGEKKNHKSSSWSSRRWKVGEDIDDTRMAKVLITETVWQVQRG